MIRQELVLAIKPEQRLEPPTKLETELLKIYVESEKHWTADGTEYVLVDHSHVNERIGVHPSGKILVSEPKTRGEFKGLIDILVAHENYEAENPSVSKPGEFDESHLKAIDFEFEKARELGKGKEYGEWAGNVKRFSNDRGEVLKHFLPEDYKIIEKAMDDYGIAKVWYAQKITEKAEHIPIVTKAIAETDREDVINLFKNDRYKGRKEDLVFLLDKLGANETENITNELDKGKLDNAIEAIKEYGRNKFKDAKQLNIYPFTGGCEILKKYDFEGIKTASQINSRGLKQNTPENIESTIKEIKNLDENSKKTAENTYSKYGHAAPTKELAIVELALVYKKSLEILLPKGYEEKVVISAYELAAQKETISLGFNEIENIAKAIKDNGIGTTKKIYPMITDSANISSVSKKIEELGLTLEDANKIYWRTKTIINDIHGWDEIISKYDKPKEDKSLGSIIDLTKEWRSGQWRINIGYILKASEYGNGLERARQAIELNAINRNIIAIVDLLERENVTKEEFPKIKEKMRKGVYTPLITGKVEEAIYGIRNKS